MSLEKEAVVIMALVAAILNALAAFGIAVSSEQYDALMALTQTLIGLAAILVPMLYARGRVYSERTHREELRDTPYGRPTEHGEPR
jgi:formate hydrogenlyase subunit 3/multisubunit Na+/H+ antiporter MnhD subunit